MIKLLVVIATLAAILFPVSAWAREKARQSSYLSNVKQMGHAFLSYAQDCDERMPPVPDAGALSMHSRDYTLQPDIRNTQGNQCPSEAGREIQQSPGTRTHAASPVSTPPAPA